MNDRKRLIAAAFVRAVATGLIGVLLGLHLVRRGLAVGDIGLVIAAGLAGAAAAALVATLAGDRIGRRRLLIILALACATGGAALAFAGVLMQLVAVGSPLVVGAAMKVIYDVLLWRAFRHIRPPEERSVAHGSAAASMGAQP
jgi:MFS family permease